VPSQKSTLFNFVKDTKLTALELKERTKTRCEIVRLF